MEPVLYSLMGLVLIGSIVALEIDDLLSSVIALGLVGLGLSIVFLLLGAPDIAITQVVVEVIVVTVLIRASGRLPPERPRRRRGKAGVVAGLGMALVLVGFVILGLASLPAFGTQQHALADWILAEVPSRAGAPNVVTAILLDVRGYDTLGEATVILTAVVGVLAVLRSGVGRARPEAAAGTDSSDEASHV